MRDIELPGFRYRLHETPEDLNALTDLAARQRRIWIDTEVADWNTPNPRLSLIQLRLGDGSIHVVDVLAADMSAAYQATFAPQVIFSPRVEKWAHYARYERQMMGQDKVQNLNCTFDLARRVPYYRLPLRTLRLAALVSHFFSTAIDKTFQKADWGHRPLSDRELAYAAWDPEWCYRVHERLRPLVQSWDPATDDPKPIERRYIEILSGLRDAKQLRSATWDAVKLFMVSAGRERFSDFLLQTRTISTVSICALAATVREVDPIGTTEFALPVPSSLLESLRPGGPEALRKAGHETLTTSFRGPLASRALAKPSYEVDPDDPNRVAADFTVADHQHRTLESEREELKDRMRAWMKQAKLKEWGGFVISDSTSRLTADVRDVARWLNGENASTAFPARFLQALTPQLATLREHVEMAETSVLRWRPDRSTLPIDIAQSRDWHGDTEST